MNVFIQEIKKVLLENICSNFRLCYTLRAIFEYGLKKPRGLSDQSSSPWKFIGEVAMREAESDSSSILSRLNLCRTFRLDEVGKVLSPEELLYRVRSN